jgi:hypothetical protein
MAVEITAELLRAAALKMAELKGEYPFVLVGAGSLAITALGRGELARSDDGDIWPRNNETAALDECIEQLGRGGAFHNEYELEEKRFAATFYNALRRLADGG